MSIDVSIMVFVSCINLKYLFFILHYNIGIQSQGKYADVLTTRLHYLFIYEMLNLINLEWSHDDTKGTLKRHQIPCNKVQLQTE